MGTTGYTRGVLGYASSASGRAIFGDATHTTGANIGVVGRSFSTAGIGVFGQAAAGSGTVYGVQGTASSPNGFAVYAQGRMRVDGNAGIGTPSPTHRLTVQSTTKDTVRLIGPTGIYGYGARLAFGDSYGGSDRVFIEEDIDDHLHLSSTQGIKIDKVGATTARVLSVESNGDLGSANAAIYANNLASGNSNALVAEAWGSGPAAVVNNRGTGSHIVCSPGAGQVVFEVKHSGRCVTTAVEITGGGDLVEGFDAAPECEPGSVVVIDAEHEGRLVQSTVAYDRKVAGVVSGAGGVAHGIKMGQDGVLDGETLVAMSGRVWVRSSTENGTIAPGDRLTTSSIAGHAMKATDGDRSDGAVIGKAMTGLDKGEGLVLVLVNLQ